MAARAEDFEHCRALVRRADRDRYDAVLFAPEALRPVLFALYAFNVEVSSLRERVREALPGEMRLQWWRDALNGTAQGDTGGHPVAAALVDAVVRHALPVSPLVALTEARIFDLYDDAMPSLTDLEGYLGETSSVLMQLSALVLAPSAAPLAADCAGHAGVAYGLTGLMRAFPYHLRRGQCYLPADLLAAEGLDRDAIFDRAHEVAVTRVIARLLDHAETHRVRAVAAARDLPKAVRPAILPLALVKAQLAGLRARPSVYAPAPPLSPFGSLARMGTAYLFGF